MDATLSAEEKREIAGRARTLHERLDGPPNESGGSQPIEPERLFEAWAGAFPDREAFEARLRREGLAESAVREQLAATRWPADRPLPDWIDDLDALLEHVTRQSADDLPASVPEETPFAELLAAVASYGRARLDDEVVPPCGVTQLETWLVSRLNLLCVRALYVEFKSFVEHHDPELAAADHDAFDDPPTRYYGEFVDAMLGAGFRNLCLEYPVLARYLVTTVEQWTTAVETVCRRLRADRDALADRFDVEGAVTELDPLAADAHAGGQFPVRVSFESGAVVYKPRPVGMGVAVHGVLDRLDDALPVPPFETPAYLPREGYGWMERIEYREPADEAAVERYYERAGALLCVAYVLGLTDCHYENHLVSGEHPVVVDAETAFVPRIDPDAMLVEPEVAATVSPSVLSTGLLPWAVGDPDDAEGPGPAMLAGFGSRGGTVALSSTSVPTVEATNTDVMSVAEEPATIDRTENTPSVDGTDRPPEEYVDAVVDGFEATYDAVAERHDDGRFLSGALDREALADRENRIVYRATTRYTSVLQSCTTRHPLRDGARLTVEFEALAAPFFDDRIESDRCWPLYAAERRALRRFDVPRFGSRPDRTTVFHDGTPVGGPATGRREGGRHEGEQREGKRRKGERREGGQGRRPRRIADASGYEQCRKRLDGMGPADRRRQVWFVRRSLTSRNPTTLPPPSDAAVTDRRLRQVATDCCDEVIAAAIDAGPAPRWLSVVGSDRDPQLGLLPAEASLYNGRGGIGLALAAVHAATGEGRYRRRAIEALDPVAARDGASLGLGGTAGLGSTVYALSVAADLLDRPGYRERAVEHAHAVTADRLHDDSTFDVTNGTAGTLLGLLAHHERYGGDAILDRAVACGERLLDARVDVEGYRAWPTTGETPIPGLAHGVAGIAYALARLAAATGDDRYATAAREALAYESTLYDPARSNYCNPLESGERRYRDRWCYGRTGCALARLGAGTYLGDDDLLAEAGALASATAAADLSPKDQVCCGNFGRAIALLEAARRTDRDVAEARTVAGRCLARRESGALSLPGHGEPVVNPTFFNGLGGVAYTLLRIREPDSLPCVLLLE